MAFARHGTLVGGAVTTVALPDTSSGVEVLNRASSGGGIYFTTDNSAPTAGGNDTFVALPGQAVTVPDSEVEHANVKLISATADAYSVTAVG